MDPQSSTPPGTLLPQSTQTLFLTLWAAAGPATMEESEEREGEDREREHKLVGPGWRDNSGILRDPPSACAGSSASTAVSNCRLECGVL